MYNTSKNSSYDLGDIVEAIGDGYCIYDWQMNIKAVNSQFAEILNTTREKVVGRNFFDIDPSFAKSPFFAPMNAILKNKQPASFSIYCVQNKKNYLLRTRMVKHEYLVTMQQLDKETEKKDFNTNKDNLTSLPNRAAFEDEIARLYTYKVQFALSIIDVNKFRLLNDSMGIDAGNICLMEIASRLNNFFKHKVYRVGPNQFAALISTEKTVALEITQKMINLFKKPFNINQEDYYISVACGFNYIDSFDLNISEIIGNTEFALQKARKIKNSYVEYTEQLQRNTLSMVLARDLKNALNTSQLTNFYQPQVNSKTGKISGAEALIRWSHPTKGVIMPNEFLMVANEHDLMQEIDKHVFITTLKDIMELQNNHNIQIPISINFSSATICNVDIINFIDRGLKKTKINPNLLTIEITETSIMEDAKKSQHVIQELSKMGLKIAVDDFGTGYSSMGYLVRYPTDFLKIDREFVQDIDKNTALQNMTSNIIKMGKSLGMKIIAEGVENKNEFEYLKLFDCDIIQGYFFSKPVSKEIFIRYIKKIGICQQKM